MPRKSKAQLDHEIQQALAPPKARAAARGASAGRKKKAGKAKPQLRIAYRLHLTPGEMRAVEFARGRYEWADMLSREAAEDGSIAFTEPQMWQWVDDVESDDAPFPLASPELAEKLQRFRDEVV